MTNATSAGGPPESDLSFPESGNRLRRYCRPRDLAEALDALAAGGARARAVAGGNDVLRELRIVPQPTEVLVDLGRVAELGTGIETGADGTLRLGALVTHQDIIESPLIEQVAPLLAEACRCVGSPSLRRRATLVGNVVSGRARSDTLCALVALGATVEIASPAGKRKVNALDLDASSPRIARDEIVTALSLAAPPADRRWAYVRFAPRAGMTPARVCSALVVELDSNLVVDGARIVAAGRNHGRRRLHEVEQLLLGRRLDGSLIDGPLIEEASRCARESSDLHSAETYERRLVGVAVARGLRRLLETPPPATAAGSAAPARRKAFAVESGPARLDLTAAPTLSAQVNGAAVEAPLRSGPRLIDWLRGDLELTGTKEACGEGACGSCTVLLDGAATLSCLVPATAAEGATITTVEGLGCGEPHAEPLHALHPLQQAMLDHGAVQCGFCTPGFLMAAVALLAADPAPDAARIDDALGGNLCRCTGYRAIVEAIESVSLVRRARSTAP